MSVGGGAGGKKKSVGCTTYIHVYAQIQPTHVFMGGEIKMIQF